MNAQVKPVPRKATRNRAILRSYNYGELSGAFKDANTQEVLATLHLENLPESVVLKLALSAAMGMVGGAMVEAHNEGEDAKAAGLGVIEELAADKVEFRDGVGVAMGGTLKRIARALCEVTKADGTAYSNVRSPDGSVISWTAGDVNSAFAAMKELWSVPEDAERTGPNTRKESGRAMVNRIKAIPEVAAKLAAYAKGKGAVELG